MTIIAALLGSSLSWVIPLLNCWKTFEAFRFFQRKENILKPSISSKFHQWQNRVLLPWNRALFLSAVSDLGDNMLMTLTWVFMLFIYSTPSVYWHWIKRPRAMTPFNKGEIFWTNTDFAGCEDYKSKTLSSKCQDKNRMRSK